MFKFSLAVVVLLSAQVYAKTDLVCTAYKNSIETTIAVSDAPRNSYSLRIYRSFHGHTAPTIEVTVYQLPGSRGSVVAYGDADQNKVLSINLNNRNSRGEVSGTFLDTSFGSSALPVTCK